MISWKGKSLFKKEVDNNRLRCLSDRLGSNLTESDVHGHRQKAECT